MTKNKIITIPLITFLIISALGLIVVGVTKNYMLKEVNLVVQEDGKSQEIVLDTNKFAQCLSIYSNNYVGDERNNLSKVPLEIRDGSVIGFVEVWGSIESVEIDYFDDKLNKVFLRLNQEKNKDIKEFFDYYINLVNSGNSINKIRNDDLLYAIGALDDNNRLYSRAGMSQKTISLLEKIINTGEVIQLRLRKTPPLGDGGAPDNFSFACAIDSEINITK